MEFLKCASTQWKMGKRKQKNETKTENKQKTKQIMKWQT